MTRRKGHFSRHPHGIFRLCVMRNEVDIASSSDCVDMGRTHFIQYPSKRRGFVDANADMCALYYIEDIKCEHLVFYCEKHSALCAAETRCECDLNKIIRRKHTYVMQVHAQSAIMCGYMKSDTCERQRARHVG